MIPTADKARDNSIENTDFYERIEKSIRESMDGGVRYAYVSSLYVPDDIESEARDLLERKGYELKSISGKIRISW